MGIITRTCLNCSVIFELERKPAGSGRGGSRDWFCSETCRKRRNVEKVTRRLAVTRGALHAEKFTLDEIYERDHGICYLCHKPCPRSEATIDHVVPVSPPHNGPHTRANVKLADRSCNSRKRDRLLSELSWYHPEETETVSCLTP